MLTFTKSIFLPFHEMQTSNSKVLHHIFRLNEPGTILKCEWGRAESQSVYSPADLDLKSGRTIIKSWILHCLQPLEIGCFFLCIDHPYTCEFQPFSARGSERLQIDSANNYIKLLIADFIRMTKGCHVTKISISRLFYLLYPHAVKERRE